MNSKEPLKCNIIPDIAIISSRVRTGRASHRVALYFKNYLETNKLATVELLDLNEYQFPVADERIRFQQDPSKEIPDFAGKIKIAYGVIMVTPEYNGGYPASFKNVLDFLYDEWCRKPIAIATVSNGILEGSQVITSLQFSLWKIRDCTVPAMFPVPKVQEAFDENGIPADKRAAGFINELRWCMEAKTKMDS